MSKTPTAALKYVRTVPTREGKIVITCRLDDECKNGHEDFSLTATIYDKGGLDIGGGCCHDEILKAAPEFEPFARLHLSDADGCPMHAAANGFYWYSGTKPDGLGCKYHPGTGSNAKTPEKCLEILKDHLRATDADIAAIDAMQPRSEEEFSFALESLGFRARWKAEADAAIAQLEKWTAAKFESRATRSQWEPLPEEAVALIKERKASGYYNPEQVAARDKAKRKADIAKRVAEIHANHAAAVAKLETERTVDLYFASRGIDGGNVIFYDHTN